MNSCVRARDSFLQPEWSRRKYEVLERYAPSVVRRLAPLPLQKHHRPCGHGRYRMQSRMNCAFSARLMWCRFPGRFLQRRCPHLRGLRRRSRRRYMTCAFRAESSGGRRAPSPKFQPSSAVGTTASTTHVDRGDTVATEYVPRGDDELSQARSSENSEDRSFDVITSLPNYPQRIECRSFGPACHAPLWLLGIVSVRIAFGRFLDLARASSRAFPHGCFLVFTPGDCDFRVFAPTDCRGIRNRRKPARCLPGRRVVLNGDSSVPDAGSVQPVFRTDYGRICRHWFGKGQEGSQGQ